MNHIAENLNQIRAEIAEACIRAGRQPEEVKLIAVSKTKPAPDVKAAIDAGQTRFGENYVQELTEKWNNHELATPNIEWHFIGHLQSNKAKFIAEKISLVHTVDKASLAVELSKHAAKPGRTIPVLLEVNISGEDSKYGLRPADVMREADAVMRVPNVELKGLMTIASPEREKVKTQFHAMQKLLAELHQHFGAGITELSMGMSGDFDLAIESGATYIRIGTAIFGARSFNI
ncbi:MAG: YggS family pyridoxal phosphate-dependent enzyme [Rhizobacter sp.]|nr:YggS family pyridoxal phosphate-dependent enzyme [Chlorobiales bacterium]